MPQLLIILIVVSLPASTVAQTTPANEPAHSESKTTSSAAVSPEKVSRPVRVDAMRALSRVLPTVDFREIGLNDVLNRFSRDMRVNIVVRWKKLEAAGLGPETPVTLSLRDVSFGEALRLVLEQASSDEELAYQVSPEKILISTLADINSEMVVRVYDVRDLTLQVIEDPSIEVGKQFTYIQSIQPVVDENAVAPQPVIGTIPLGVSLHLGPGGGDDFDLNEGFTGSDNDDDERERAPGDPGTIEELINAIVATIEPQSWVAAGGKGTIVPFNGQLVVRNSLYVHQLLGGVSGAAGRR